MSYVSVIQNRNFEMFGYLITDVANYKCGQFRAHGPRLRTKWGRLHTTMFYNLFYVQLSVL